MSDRASPILCEGYEINTPDQREFDCKYKHAGAITCDTCIVNGGPMDPRTGKRFRQDLLKRWRERVKQ